MRMNFGRKDEIGEIDFGKVKSDIKINDVVKDNEALKSIFSKFDKNADGVLSSEEIDSIEATLKQVMGDDDNLSLREAKKIFDSKNRKEDAKNLFIFLRNLASTTVGIKSVSNPTNQDGVKEEIVYEDGRKETIFEDGSKVIVAQIGEKQVSSKFNAKGNLIQVVENDEDGSVKTTDFDEEGNLKKQTIVKNNGNYIETTKIINGKTLTTIENKEAGVIKELVEGELVKEIKGKTVIQYRGNQRTETTTDGDWKQVDSFEDDVLKARTVTSRTEDGKSKVVSTTYDGENSVSNTRIDNKKVSQTKVVDGVTYTINYDGEGNTKVIVQNGESISALAKKFGCTVEEIVKANSDKVKGSGANVYFLVGEEIVIPREVEADSKALQGRKSSNEAKADYKAYDDAIKAEQARQAEAARAAAEAQQAEVEQAEKQQQREAEKARAREFAQGFYDIADHNTGVRSMDKMLEFLNANITSANIVDFLNAYTDPNIRKKDSSIIDTVISEIGPGFNKTGKQKAVLLKIINTLAEAALKAGVPEGVVSSLKQEFVSSMNAELDNGVKRTDPTKMEIALDSLLGQIAAAKSGAVAVSEEEAMETVAGDFKEVNDQATEDFEAAREEDSWIAKAGDKICGWFGCNTVEEMRAKLGENASKVDALIEAAKAGDKAEFKRIYKDLFGVEFDPNLIAASEKANEDYMNALIAKSQVDSMNQVLSQINDSMSFDEIAGVIKNLYSNDPEISADDVINEIIKMYTDAGYPATTDDEKKAILLDFVNSTKEANESVLKELTANKTMDELARDAELISKSAFGTNDISKMVNEFNQNMVMTDAIGTAAVEIGATVLLQFVPGLGQAAAARLAVSAARWGVKGAKIANYAKKAGAFFRTVSKLQAGTASASKVVNAATRIGTQAVTAGVATAGVGASKHEDTKTILQRVLMNASFAGAGVASNMIAPKLMQAFNISNQLATEIAEEIINAAAAYGISTVNGEVYGTQDAFLDFITGLVMARIAGGGAARAAVKGVDVDVNKPRVDADVPPVAPAPKHTVDSHQVNPDVPKVDQQAKGAERVNPDAAQQADAPKAESADAKKANNSEAKPESESKADSEVKSESRAEAKAERQADRQARADKLKDLRARLGNKLARAYVKIENTIKNMKNMTNFNKISTSIRTKFANFKTEMNELLDKLNAKMKSLRQTAQEPEWVKSKRSDSQNNSRKSDVNSNASESRANEYNRNTARAEAYAKFNKNQQPINLKGEGSLSKNAQYALDMNDLPELYLYDGTHLDFSQGELRARIDSLAEGDFFTIGRQGDVVVGNEYISRQHILVTKHNGQIIIKDISQNGGTYARTRESGSANNRRRAQANPKADMLAVFNKYLPNDMKLSNDATPEQVKKAYRKLSVEHHPDKYTVEIDKKEHEEIFKNIASKYDEYCKSLQK